ncbi:MAG: sulfite reductase subunit alpha [Euryarchaeota archaeon]|jgi:sulfite reductase (NADPH) flavoprotein alpha-component|nr:sulfite reductase subunit alpha [Euryarchaeota archaeon]|tara:strand:- start:3335 stop:5179 length:1845 start_codon:yes stop_codon:yes gene_type:complete
MGLKDMSSQPRSILILYGSQSGNSEELAEQAGKACSAQGLNPSVKAMDEIQITDLSSQKRVLVCCSTWGDGEQPDNAEDLWEAANSGAISSLKGLNFSVLALGDTSYDLFCESGKEWDAWFEKMGANRVHQRVDCDVDFEGPAAEWTAAVIPLMVAIEDDPDAMDEDSSSTSATEVTAVSSEIPTKTEKSQWNAKNPYSTKITQNYVLNGEGSGKETRHIVFELGDSGLNYKAGDALGVVPRCPPEVVAEILSMTALTGEEIVETYAGECTLKEALMDKYEVHRVSKKWIESLGPRLVSSSSSIEIKIVSRKRTSSRDGTLLVEWKGSGEGDDLPERYVEIGMPSNPSEALWNELTSDSKAMEDYMWSRDYVDALSDFGHIGFSAQQLIEGMDRLKPRLYSIASSPDHEPGTVHLTVGIVRYNHHDRDKTGLCTGFLADRCQVEETDIGVFMSPTRSFVLPSDGSVDAIMVGPGTGIAPFRAFLQQRDINGDTGRNWLFFGDWTEEGEYYYRDEMESWKERGVLDKHDLAWSRQGSEKVYVQHLMKKNGEEIWKWIDGGGYFYVCGDKNYMAKDVHTTLIEICSEFGSMTPDEAKDFVETKLMKTEKRYLRDVY